jgi:GR25 family glycosyltransferase involved in LPS biosynthesis
MCHHPPLTERRLYFEQRMKLLEIDFVVIDKFGPKEVGGVFNKRHLISDAEISLYLKHIYAFKMAMSSEQHIWTLILEDDCEIEPDMPEIIHSALSLHFDGEGIDMIWFGVCCDLHAKADGMLAYSDTAAFPLTTRCTHCYALTRGAAKKILLSAHLCNFDKPIDHKLNDIILAEKLRVAWYEPGIPQVGQFKSSLR